MEKKMNVKGKKIPNFRNSFLKFKMKFCYLTFMALFLKEVAIY